MIRKPKKKPAPPQLPPALRAQPTMIGIQFHASLGDYVQIDLSVVPIRNPGLPSIVTAGGLKVIGMTQLSPTSYGLTFNGSLDGTGPYQVRFYDPVFRSPSGGYLLGGSYTLT